MNKKSFIRIIQFWGVLCIVGMGVSFAFVEIFNTINDYNVRLSNLRSNYVFSQKQMIQQEVYHVVDRISQIKWQSELMTKENIRSRVYEAHAMAEHLYHRFHHQIESNALQQMIIEAIRPIRFENGAGYYFITRLDGVEMLFADKPQMEGLNLLSLQDTQGRYVIQDMIALIEKYGEGYYDYQWTKPDSPGKDHRKISFIKRFEPFDWFIGTGLYFEDVEALVKEDLLKSISQIRFGKEGYIFVNRWNGDALVSNGQVFSGSRKLWEEFEDNEEQAKKIFEMEIEAARKPGGDFINYSWIRLSDSDIQSPKISFIYGLPEFQWLVGAGVYLDDVENEIEILNDRLKREITFQAFSFVVIAGVILFVFWIVFKNVGRRISDDFDLFLSFFNRSAPQDGEIQRGAIRFVEFDRMAKYINKMTHERNAAERILRISEKRLESILAANPNPVVVYDAQGHPQYINQSFTTLFGWTMEELSGKTIPFVPEDEKGLTMAKIKEIYRTGGTLQFLTKRMTKSGKLRNVNISAAVYKDPEGETTGLVVNLTDMTEQLGLEAQLAQAQKMESVGRLAGGVAHDFNNMLSVILGNIELIRDELDPSSSIASGVEEIEKAARRSADLTRQLLAFARKQTISPKILDLNDTIEGMLKMLKRLMGEDIDLSWQPDSGLWPIKIDPSQIDQILANLCVNARDSIQGVGKVTIETENIFFDEAYCEVHPGFRPGSYVQISISDNGCGMDEETMKNLFEPFFTTKKLGKGTGLGLATVYGILKQNNGFINVYSEPGEGTTFKIYLPRHGKHASLDIGQSDEKPLRGGSETILLVEDEAAILNMTTLMLQRLGYQVLAAGLPDEAQQIAETATETIHLLMTDVVMPGMNGRDLSLCISRIRPGIKTLYMSGYTANVIAHHGILDDGLFFISKPFSKEALSKKLREILDDDPKRS